MKKEKDVKARCKNLFCSAMDLYLSEKNLNENYKTIKCPTCGFVGVMPYGHILTTDEIIRQIKSYRETKLYRDLFKTINFDKLPRSLEQQLLE